MSGIGAWIARAVAAFGGPQTAGIILVAGIVLGGAGGAIIAKGAASGSGSGSGAGATLAVYPCPNQGPALATIGNGQQLLVTGRSSDSAWLRIHLPTPGRDEGWVQAGPLTVKGSVDTLPVATCAAEANAPAPAGEPAPSLTAIVTATASAPPSPTPTPSPSPVTSPSAPTAVPPSVTALTVSATKISYDQGAYCPTAAKSTTITTTVSDAAGVASVTLYWRKPGASGYAQTAMTMSSGSATSGTWQATLSTTSNGISTAGSLAYYIAAADSTGATGRLPSSGAKSITVAVCANPGPTISQASSSSGSSLYWDPLGVGKCQTATDLTAAVTDADGVKSVTLFYRKPGSSSWASKPMDNQTLPGKWYANLDTLGDSIPIVKPPTGTLSWYIKAVDSKNASSQSKTAAITVRRCDSPGSVQLNQVASSHYTYGNAGCPAYSPSVRIGWTFYVGDPDVIASLTLHYSIVNQAIPGKPQAPTITRTVTVSVGSQPISVSSIAFDGATYAGSELVTWDFVATDRYGGKTTGSNKATVSVLVC